MAGVEQIVFAPGLEGIDQRASLWINSLHCGWTDPFWVFMSGINVWIPMYALIAALLLWRLGWKKGLIAIACIVACFVASEQINNLIKHLVMRVRPCNHEGMIAAGLHILETGGGWSFPSGHSNNSFAFAVSSLLCLKIDGRRTWKGYSAFILCWASLVAISRIMVARHFLGDILVGSLLGAALGLLFGFIATKICAIPKLNK